MDNEKLYEYAREAISKLFADSSVSEKTTELNLKGLKDEIEKMIDSLGIIEEDD